MTIEPAGKQDADREIPPPSDPSELYVLGGMYFQGITVPVDKEKAVILYTMSAEKGYVDSMVRLGIIYMTGDGAEQDYLRAAKLFDRAAQKGNTDAMFLLSTLYSRGMGVDRNPPLAVKLCSQASREGCVGAMVELARWYRDGSNMLEKNTDACVSLLKQAADEKYSEALYELGCMFCFGEDVEKDESNGRILLRYAVEYGDEDAQEALDALDAGATERPR